MRIKFSIFLLVCYYVSLGQDSLPISKIDTLIPFYGTTPVRRGSEGTRVIPFGSYNPLYVKITYEGGTRTKLEYFKVDSSKYLIYEYYKEFTRSSNQGIKNRGERVITNVIIDSSEGGVIHMSRARNRQTRKIHYFKEFLKDGEWEEYQDSTFEHIYWTGNYTKGKRVGLWKHLIYWGGDNFLLGELDYSKDSAELIHSVNIAYVISTDSLKFLLKGRWKLRSCDSDEDRRMAFSKCKLYDGQ